MTGFGNLSNLKTGDIMLFKSKPNNPIGILDAIIRFFTRSDFVHIGMILKNPSFIDNPLKGLYLWESSWEGTPDPNDGKIKLGVQITPLFQILQDYSNKENGEIYIRQVHCNSNNFSNENLLNIYKIVHNKIYDIELQDWVEALVKKDPFPQKTNRFWCSALVGYIYTKCGLLNEKTDWSILRPSDFSESKQNLKFNNKNIFLEKQFKLNYENV